MKVLNQRTFRSSPYFMLFSFSQITAPRAFQELFLPTSLQRVLHPIHLTLCSKDGVTGPRPPAVLQWLVQGWMSTQPDP